jgi:DNA-binding CsgD family transcriptional regulator
VPFDAAFWSTLDPETLLFTAPHQHEVPPDTVPYFLENEFVADDVNKFTALARDTSGVRTLAQATGGKLEASARYRDLFRGLGLGDELRAVLRVGGACWGCLCLHREDGTPFSEQEVQYVRRLAPQLADGIRAGLLAASLEAPDPAGAPGLVVVDADGVVLSATEAGRIWLERLGTLPPAGQLRRSRRLRVQTRAGGWAVLHASPLPDAGPGALAVIVDAPSASELARLLMLAYGLTGQERAVTTLVCRGLSTREIGDRLHISANTVQDHLKSIFDKTGVRSRRELVVVILREQYLPRAQAGRAVAPSGFFEA